MPKHTKIRVYPMRGRLKCGVCGSAMVGQTMTSKGREYRYYGCRHIYDRRTGTDCTSRYVRADGLEQGLWRKVQEVLAHPSVVLHEMRNGHQPDADAAELEALETKLASLAAREKRLVTLFSYGEVDEQVVREQIASVRREQTVLNDRLRSLRPVPRPMPVPIDEVMRLGLLAPVRQLPAGWIRPTSQESASHWRRFRSRLWRLASRPQ